MERKQPDAATKVRGTSFRARERAIRLELEFQRDRDRGSEYPYDGMTVAQSTSGLVEIETIYFSDDGFASCVTDVEGKLVKRVRSHNIDRALRTHARLAAKHWTHDAEGKPLSTKSWRQIAKEVDAEFP